MNSYFLDPAPRAQIRATLAKVNSKIKSTSKVSVSIVGWVQPTRISPNVMGLSKGRARAVMNYMKQLGFDARYKTEAPGEDKLNIPSSRRATVVIKWSDTK